MLGEKRRAELRDDNTVLKDFVHGWTCTSNTSQFPPPKSICETGLAENAPKPVMESKMVAEGSLLMLMEPHSP